MKTRLAIVYFSGFGHTQKLTEAIADGISSVENTEVKTYKINVNGEIPETWLEELTEADAIIYGSPTYMGSVAWQFKKFADASGAVWSKRAWKNKITGGFTVSGSTNGDKHSTMSYLTTLAMQHGQIWVGLGLLSSNKKKHGPKDINWTGGYAGLLAIAPSDASPEEAPRIGDLETAIHYGARLAEITHRLK
ncbi:MAG: flavodoxin family protein [Bacteroidota bacterium]